MAKKNTPDAKNRILQAAVKIFAHKSFEGSRIDEIAQEAEVPKSLIYYHFKSKDEILEVLMQGFINEYTQLLREAESDSHQKKAGELPKRMGNVYKDFGEKNADLVRIILIESLKKSEERPMIYKIVEAIAESEEKSAISKNSKNYDRNERMIAEFFTSFLTNCAYLCFAESWTNYFGIDKNEFGKLFLKVYTETHGAYHKYHD